MDDDKTVFDREGYTVYFKAVQYFLADTRHYNANRDIGQLLSATEYEDDLDLEEEEDDEYENDSFIDDGSIEEEREEGESSEAADESEASSSIEESTQASDAEGSQYCISDDFDSEPYMQTPPCKIPLNGTASLGSAYRLGKRRDSSSPSPALPPPSTLRKRRRASPDFDTSPLVSPISKANSASKASPRRFPSVDSLDHPEDSDDAEEDKPEARQQSRRRKRRPPKAAHRPRKGKQKALTSEMEIFLSGSEESDGNEDYAGSATENVNLSDLADGAQSRQLRSGRKYGPNKSTPSKEIASKESSPRGIGPARPTKVEISSAVDSGSDELNRLSTRSTPRRTSNPDAQRISHLPELTSHVLISDQTASSSKRRRTAYRVVSSSDDGSRSPSPERPAHRFRRLRRWSERTA
ncbi:uncharacterized protein ARMOST_18757 [Armillaria ostoyae]|uniref:Uncharacterized protein n=1 Tax=Armillaria ostoyae TaxID=47428 RepID=A0A284S2S5_ARMOS|nr:uncharacterized protein ARMOST_18757 [Armillaria ostoyae]